MPRALARGDAAARDELVALACRRLTLLTRKMLDDYNRLRNWEETADISQNAVMRLHRALEQVSPSSPPEFFGLAALKIRQELQDLARHYYGRRDDARGEQRAPDRSPAHAMTGFASDDSQHGAMHESGDATLEPRRLAQWTEFHRVVNELPEKERQVVDLLFYHEMTQEDAAAILEVDPSTVKRRWRSARLKLFELLQHTLPDF